MRRLKNITLLITGASLGLCLDKGSAGEKATSEALQLFHKLTTV